MIGFEMSEDRQSKKPLRGELVSQIWEGAKEQGVVFGRGGLWGQVRHHCDVINQDFGEFGH